MNLTLGIDASRNRSGGPRAHLRGILGHFEPRVHGFDRIHVWTHSDLAATLPARPDVVVHTPAALDGGSLRQIFWQWRSFGSEAKAKGCDVVFSSDGSTVGDFWPMVIANRDLLAFEPGVRQLFGPGRMRLRLMGIRMVQKRALRKANGVIFLTEYSRATVERVCGTARRGAVVPHGVDEVFRGAGRREAPLWPKQRTLRLLYISPINIYKNQWHVVHAVSLLKQRGYSVQLKLVGGGNNRGRRFVNDVLRGDVSLEDSVEICEFVEHSKLPSLLAESDIFVFASSCEAFGITLLEAMASGIPIACSNRSSLPEVGGNGCVYFDPTSSEHIADVVERLVCDPGLRRQVALRAAERAQEFSWKSCADMTFSFLRQIASDANLERAKQ